MSISKKDYSKLAGDIDGTKFVGEPTIRILSLGAGVQSSTMALMADEGAFGIKPDAAVFADTGWEPDSVLKHLEWLKKQLSYPVHICKKGNLNEDILKALRPGGNQFVSAPFYTLNKENSARKIAGNSADRQRWLLYVAIRKGNSEVIQENENTLCTREQCALECRSRVSLGSFRHCRGLQRQSG